MREIEYPYKNENLIKKKRQIKNQLLNNVKGFTNIKVAILAGSTVNELRDLIEIFLLSQGIKAEFYISEYNRYYEEAVFENIKLNDFNPDIIYIFTSFRNIIHDFDLSTSEKFIDDKFDYECNKYLSIWKSIKEKYNSIVIQNTFEYPSYRLLGNKDISDVHGLSNFLMRLNNYFCEYASKEKSFFICDLNYIAANYGLSKWHSEKLYALYKLPCDLMAFPDIAFNVANIIKSIYGKNKKAIAVDLDNTLWAGVVSEDGIENVKIGKETAEGEIYLDFQMYLKKIKSLGILLNVVSKNDENLAIECIEKIDGALKKDDFVAIKANFEPKSDNIINLAKSLNIGADSFVFIDDNPMERDIVDGNVDGIGIVHIDGVETYKEYLDKSGFFEVTNVTNEDIDKTRQYQENFEREKFKDSFVNYKEYLKSLDMRADIKAFDEMYFDRISQLTNKSNQFNLTTKRYTLEDIKKIAHDNSYITLSGKLIDKFGDNGIVSLAIGKIENDTLNIELFLMSCRVLKRDMEFAMFDKLVGECKKRDIKKIKARYLKTDKNSMVKNLLSEFGFTKLSEDSDENSEWELDDLQNYKCKCEVIN